MRLHLLLAVFLLAVAGCGSSRDGTVQKQREQVETVSADFTVTVPMGGVAVPLPVQGKYQRVLKEEEKGTTHEERRVEMPEMGALLALAGKVAGGGIGGEPLTLGLGVVSAVAAAYAAHQRARANTEAKRAEEHKADAAEGWAQRGTGA